jgi:hypothetical protein
LTTGWLVDQYISLCHDPLHDLQQWLADHNKNNQKKARHSQPQATRLDHAQESQVSSAGLARAGGFRENPLRQLRSGMDAHGREWSADGLSSGSRTRLGWDDGLRSLRAKAEGGTAETSLAGCNAEHTDSDPLPDIGAELGAIGAHYKSLIAAARHSLSPAAAAAAISALRNEKKMAIRNALDRWSQSPKNAASRRPPQTSSARATLHLPRTLG